jgi:hypothetical protein
MVHGSPGKLMRAPYLPEFDIPHSPKKPRSPLQRSHSARQKEAIQLETTVASPLGDLTQRFRNEENQAPVKDTPKPSAFDIEEGSVPLTPKNGSGGGNDAKEPTTYLLWFTVFIVAMGSSFQFGYGTGTATDS